MELEWKSKLFCTVKYKVDGISSVLQKRKLRVFTVTSPWPHSDLNSAWYEYVNLALLATQCCLLS